MNNFVFIKKQRVITYFVIGFDYDENLVKKVKKIPSAKFRSREKMWYARITPDSCVAIKKFITENNFSATDEVLDTISEKIEKTSELKELSSSEDSDIELPDFPIKPYNFQKAGVEYMLKTKRCFNADDMGLGKTAQTLMTLETGNLYPAIIITPNVAKNNWRKEIESWIPHRRSMVFGDVDFNSGYDIYILNYEAVKKYLTKSYTNKDKKYYSAKNWVKEEGFKCLVCDESQYVKNYSSQRTKAVKALSKNFEYVYLLSGTIIDNRPKEFISQLQIMRRLNDFGGYQYFINRYCDAKPGFQGHMDIDGESHLGELNDKLKKICMIRRRKIDIIDELPEKEKRIIPFKIDNKNEYEYAKNNILEWLRDEKIKKESNNILDLFGDYNKNEDEEELGFDIKQEAIELQIINSLKVITARGKLEGAIKWIRKFKKTGKKLVVFSYHKEVQNRIIKEFPEACRIMGGMTSTQKTKNENLFKENGNWLMNCSLKVANSAVNLQTAHTILCIELAWTPSSHDQMEDRIWRLGQENDCTIYYAIGKDTIDEDIYELIEEKRKVIQESIDGFSDVKNVNIKEELIKRLELNAESVGG